MEQKHILVVDDVTINLRCAGEVLKEKYKVTMAKSGRQALELLEEIQPDLILLDVKMPDLDGYETLDRIRSMERCKHIPVVFMTAESGVRKVRPDADGCIYKPIKPSHMLDCIQEILNNKS